MTVAEAYAAKVAAGELSSDPSQHAIALALDELSASLATWQRARPAGVLRRLTRKKATGTPQGLYIHGEVGRGKTMLMDLFFAGVGGISKRRVHFHAFMQDVHARLHQARQKEQDAIAPVAGDIAAETSLLCLDEMQITDIADAMIVGRLFEALFALGLVVVTTANQPPDELYRNGLNRQLFLPFIALMGRHMKILGIDNGPDHRLGRVKAHETFITPLGAEATAQLDHLWMRLTDTEQGAPQELPLLGRQLHVPQAAHACARFGFADLCQAPLGPADYLEIARNFRTVFIDGIPEIAQSQRNEARRFIVMVDTFYDAGVKLVASSAKAPEGIYVSGDHRIEFARTISRLREMQSAGWWGKKIAET